jgi:hypothetical protein
MSDRHEGMHMAKRELIDTGTDKRYVRRDKQGGSKRAMTWGALLLPIGKKAKTEVKSGQGDRGDRAKR